MHAHTAEDGEDTDSEVAEDKDGFGVVEVGESTRGDLERAEGEGVGSQNPLEHAQGEVEIAADLQGLVRLVIRVDSLCCDDVPREVRQWMHTH